MRITEVEPILLRGDQSYGATEGADEATDNGDSKVTIKTTTGTSGEVAGKKMDDHKSTTKTEIEGDVGMPYLGVKSIKKLSNSCR